MEQVQGLGHAEPRRAAVVRGIGHDELFRGAVAHHPWVFAAAAPFPWLRGPEHWARMAREVEAVFQPRNAHTQRLVAVLCAVQQKHLVIHHNGSGIIEIGLFKLVCWVRHHDRVVRVLLEMRANGEGCRRLVVKVAVGRLGRDFGNVHLLAVSTMGRRGLVPSG